MRREIWKFSLVIADNQNVAMPDGARILCAQMQGEALCIWAVVDPKADFTARRFAIRGTGHPLYGDEGTYIGTAQQLGGALIWHVFDGGASPE